MGYNTVTCWKCRKPIDTTNPEKDPYFRSVTHNTYMHLGCFEDYERETDCGAKGYMDMPKLRTKTTQ